jgi:hypothetical protein
MVFTSGLCPKHNCVYTGFGNLVFCPKCENGDYNDTCGYFADFMGVKNTLGSNACILEVYKDLDYVKDTVKGVIKGYVGFHGNSGMSIDIFKVQRTDLHELNFTKDEYMEGDPESATVFAGFQGCNWFTPKGCDTTLMPRAYVEAAPIYVITEKDV